LIHIFLEGAAEFERPLLMYSISRDSLVEFEGAFG